METSGREWTSSAESSNVSGPRMAFLLRTSYRALRPSLSVFVFGVSFVWR